MVVGSVVLAVVLYVLSLISVPVIVFFPAYSIYFFAARYPSLAAVLYPAPPALRNLRPAVASGTTAHWVAAPKSYEPCPQEKRRPRMHLMIKWSVAPVMPTPTPKLNSHFGPRSRSMVGKICCCCSRSGSKPVIGPSDP